MPKLSTYQARFTAGIFGKRLRAAEDLDRFTTGAADILNGVCQPQGGVLKRSGTRYWGPAHTSGAYTRLQPFVSGQGIPYMLEFGDQVIRVLDRDGVVTTIAGVDELPQSFLPDLCFHASGDVLWITDRTNSRFFEIHHLGPTNWVGPIGVPIKGQPYLPEDPLSGVTLTASAVIGNDVTLTASAPIFDPSDFGRAYRIRHPSGAMPGDAWYPQTRFDGGAEARSNQNLYVNQSAGGDSGNGAPLHQDGAYSDGKLTWQWLHDGAGTFGFGAFVSPTQIRGTVYNRLPAAAATRYWSAGAWCATEGFPAVGTIYEDRHWYMGSATQRDTLWGSAFGDAYKFKASTGLGVVVDTDAIVARPSTPTVASPAWLAGMERLLIGTSEGVQSLQGATETQALTPAGARLRPVSRWGCALAEPAIVGQSLFYIQRGNQILREVTLADASAASAFNVANASLIADDLMAPGIDQLAWVNGSGRDGALFARRMDGALVALTSEPEEKVRGWHRHVIAGSYRGGPAYVEQIASLKRQSDNADELWLVVKRTIAGRTVRQIEILEQAFYAETTPQHRAWMVDCGLRYDGWNAVAGRTLKLAGPSYAVGDLVTATANFALFGGGAGQIGIGRRIGLGQPDLPRYGQAVWPPAMAEVTAIVSPTVATVQLVTALPANLHDLAIGGFAIGATTISGLDHLEGETVAVNGDGGDAGRFVVTDGALHLGVPAFVATVGLAYGFRVETLNVTPQPGALRGGSSRLVQVVVSVLDSLGGQVSAPGFDKAKIPDRQGGDPYGWPAPLRSLNHVLQVNGNAQEDCRVLVEQSEPLPFCLLAIKAEVQSAA